MNRKIISYILALVIGFGIIIPKNILANSNILYTEKKSQTITSGVKYEEVKRLYKSGWKDIYVLTIDLKDPNVDVEILDSITEHGLKKSVEDLAKENGAIAAINADFFGSGNPGSSMGQVIVDGKVNEAQNYYNGSSNKYAGFFIDRYGNAFIDYLNSNLRLYNDKGSLLELQAKNKITDFKKPIYFDRSIITSTVDLDKRRKDLFKVVVENNIIIKKAVSGEVVDIPENGYIIVMDELTASSKLALFNVGEKVIFNENYNFAFRDSKSIAEVLTGTSAGGEILRNGKVISQGLTISPNIRNPRSAIGVNKDKNKVIMIAVDGRRESVGANHAEMAEILLEYGAYDAIHLDGGGSTTFVLREEGERDVKIVNNVSEKSPRLVPNAIGIKSISKLGEVYGLGISVDKKDEEAIIAGVTYPLKAYGYDINRNPVDIDLNKVKFSFLNPEDGTINGSNFIPNRSGDLTIKATYENGVIGEISFKVVEGFSAINIIPEKTSLDIGEVSSLSLTAVNKDGFSMSINPSLVDWSLDNEDIGSVKNNIFYAKNEGVVNLNASYNGIESSITMAVGNMSIISTSFEEGRDMFMSYFPENQGVSGGAGITNTCSFDGTNSLLLSYSFKENLTTPQASYVCFERQPIILSGNPTSIEMQVKGDGSDNMLKAVLKDRNNREYVIPVVNNLNSTEWVTARLTVPIDVVYPIRLDKLYVATFSTIEDENGIVYIDSISSITKRNDGGISKNSYKDYLNQNINGTKPSSGEEDINVFGQTANKTHSNSKSVLLDSINVMKQNSRALVFVGDTNLSGFKTGVSTIQWNNKYTTTNTNNLSIINLATKSGNMRVESPDQWRWLQSYMENQSKNNILINMDKNIWDKNNGLTGTRENVLFHKILKDFVIRTGKNVIVVSAVSDKTEVKVKDGVRYVNLNGLTTKDPNNLTNYKYLKIRADKNSLKYEICNVYN